MTIDLDKLKADLERDEGRRNLMYRDSKGIATVGIGHNMQRPLSDRVVDMICEDDMADVTMDLDNRLPWWRSLPEPRARGLANMAFNLGLPRLLEFEKMLAALEAGDVEGAATEALDSAWAREVGDRAERIATLFRSV